MLKNKFPESRCAAFYLNVEDERKKPSHKPALENFSTSASLHSLILDRLNHPNNVLLSYLNINSLKENSTLIYEV